MKRESGGKSEKYLGKFKLKEIAYKILVSKYKFPKSMQSGQLHLHEQVFNQFQMLVVVRT